MEVIKDLRRLSPRNMDRAYEQSKKYRIVNDIMIQKVVTTTRKAMMSEAARTMGEKHIGSLIVVENDEPIGIVTERDLLSKVLMRGLDPLKVEVERVMSSPLISIDVSTTIKETARMMVKTKGRLAVFDSGKLVGIVTASDLIKTIPQVDETLLKVDDFMTKKVITADETTKVSAISRTMGEKRIGSVVITRNGKPMGIFTERDLLTTFLAAGRSLEVEVGMVCSSPLLVIQSLTTVNETAYVMTSKHIRRLGIVESETLVGIITARDLVAAYAI